MTDHLTPADVERIRERADKATKGPWAVRYWADKDGTIVGIANETIKREIGTCGPAESEQSGWNDEHGYNTDNGTFIAHSRTDVPALCDALTQAWGDIDTYHNALAEREAELTRLWGVVEEGVEVVERIKNWVDTWDPNLAVDGDTLAAWVKKAKGE